MQSSIVNIVQLAVDSNVLSQMSNLCLSVYHCPVISIEKWLWMDIFIWICRCIGVVSLLGTGVTIALAAVATVWDWDNPRFMGVECLLNSFT